MKSSNVILANTKLQGRTCLFFSFIFWAMRHHIFILKYLDILPFFQFCRKWGKSILTWKENEKRIIFKISKIVLNEITCVAKNQFKVQIYLPITFFSSNLYKICYLVWKEAAKRRNNKESLDQIKTKDAQNFLWSFFSSGAFLFYLYHIFKSKKNFQHLRNLTKSWLK